MVTLSNLSWIGNTQVLFTSLPQPAERGRHVPPQGLNGLSDKLQSPLLSTSAFPKGDMLLPRCPPTGLMERAGREVSGLAGPGGSCGCRCPQPRARARRAAAGRTHHVGEDLLAARRGAGQHHPLADQLPQHRVQHHGGGRQPSASAPR